MTSNGPSSGPSKTAKRRSGVLSIVLQFSSSLLLVAIGVAYGSNFDHSTLWNNNNNTDEVLSRRLTEESSISSTISVFVSHSETPNAAKLLRDLEHSPSVQKVVVLNHQEPKLPKFVLPACGNDMVQNRYQEFQTTHKHLALELLKYCALSEGGLFLDSDSPMVSTLEDLMLGSKTKNMAVLNDEYVPRAIHGAFLYLKDGSIAQQMVQVLTTTSFDVLKSSPLLLPKSLYDAIAAQAKVGALTPGALNEDWHLLQHKCTINPLGGRQVTAPISNYALNSYRYVFRNACVCAI
jgi:hypothetical protein